MYIIICHCTKLLHTSSLDRIKLFTFLLEIMCFKVFSLPFLNILNSLFSMNITTSMYPRVLKPGGWGPGKHMRWGVACPLTETTCLKIAIKWSRYGAVNSYGHSVNIAISPDFWRPSQQFHFFFEFVIHTFGL
jgi:hypothetical protein